MGDGSVSTQNNMVMKMAMSSWNELLGQRSNAAARSYERPCIPSANPCDQTPINYRIRVEIVSKNIITGLPNSLEGQPSVARFPEFFFEMGFHLPVISPASRLAASPG